MAVNNFFFSSNSDAMVKTLDAMSFDDVLKVFGDAYDKLGSKLHNKITRKLKNYADSTKRDNN